MSESVLRSPSNESGDGPWAHRGSTTVLLARSLERRLGERPAPPFKSVEQFERMLRTAEHAEQHMFNVRCQTLVNAICLLVAVCWFTDI